MCVSGIVNGVCRVDGPIERRYFWRCDFPCDCSVKKSSSRPALLPCFGRVMLSAFGLLVFSAGSASLSLIFFILEVLLLILPKRGLLWDRADRLGEGGGSPARSACCDLFPYVAVVEANVGVNIGSSSVR